MFALHVKELAPRQLVFLDRGGSWQRSSLARAWCPSRVRTGMLMTFWGGPMMTQGRLLLAVAMTGYILAAVKWLEERDLRKAFGTEYARYEREVPMLLPMRMPRPSPKVHGDDGGASANLEKAEHEQFARP